MKSIFERGGESNAEKQTERINPIWRLHRGGQGCPAHSPRPLKER